MNKGCTGLNGHLRHQRLYTDFFSEGLIFAYQQPHHIINKIKTVRLYTDFFSEGLIFAYQQPHHIINKIKTVSKTH